MDDERAGATTSTAGPRTSPISGGAFGPNAWLVDDMYQRFLEDPGSVSESWREFFADYSRGAGATTAPGQPTPTAPASAPSPSPPAPSPGPAPAAVPLASAAAPPVPASLAPPIAEGDELVALRGAAGRIVSNMKASLEVPTATSVRNVPARLLEVNRRILNNHLERTSGAKVSFTHLIGYAVVRALGQVPALNSRFVEDADGKGTPGVVHHSHVGLGIAVDHQRADGTRTLLVPCIANADTLDFRSFVLVYEELIRKVHTGKLSPDDFRGTTVSLTNPGTIGTAQSVPRLMAGQGAIIGVGALAYPAGFEAADPQTIAELGIGKVLTLTSTYDHRIIQGAESGLFLAKVAAYLAGEDDFYDEVFSSMGVPYEPARWHADVNADGAWPTSQHQRALKQVHVESLINMYRVRGHLMAHLDPLEVEPPDLHPELDPLTYGLSIWDLPRRFVADGLAGRDVATLDEILHILRDAYCRTLGIEYMHIQDPEQKRWIQHQVEGVTTSLSSDEQHHILERLNAAEVFERFLHSRYIGQKRFGLEGAESVIVLLDALLDEAAQAGTSEVVMGMAHRGRLNVLANIVGKSYREIFEEFEGNLDPESVQGSGDVKYHKGAQGKFTGRSGIDLPITVASNPSHLEAVDPVVVGMARAKQDRLVPPSDGTTSAVIRTGDQFPVLSLLLHGDAAFAGQGVVAETLNLSGLSGYRTGGTVHVVINNQLGFTTAPEAARTSWYPTDVAKMVQSPIFHVNGDDPEACVRAARLALGFRNAFHKDVVIDLVSYRRHGHNEGDDPSYTQPLMYQRIEERRSVRKLYTETLMRRGDITLDEAERALDNFNARLQTALDEVRSVATTAPAISLPSDTWEDSWREPEGVPVETGVDETTLRALMASFKVLPDGFVIHPKLARQFGQRDQMVQGGKVDWALAESLALGTILLEGSDVRLTGQDTRRGTFSQRHGVLVDYVTGREYVPLTKLDGTMELVEGREHGDELGRFTLRDSLLSEYAALGFEYGYSVESPESLVAWEAQFGDFANGAQIIIDNFLVSAEDKWGQRSSLVLLLPHGYEGQGPEHSSARIERFLTLSARGNMRVTQPTTASQYFHLLRSQVHQSHVRPLVVCTPKSLLRAPFARSELSQLTSGGFAPVLDDESVDPAKVRRIVLCSGKIAYDATRRRSRARRSRVRADGGRSGGADLPVARRGHRADPRQVWRRRGARLAAGGAREHGGLELRARAAAPDTPQPPAPPSREPPRVGQPGDRQRGSPPARAEPPGRAGHSLT